MGDIVPAAELWFPFDPDLRDRARWDDVAVTRPARRLPLVEETYAVDPSGGVEVRITDLSSGWSQAHRL